MWLAIKKKRKEEHNFYWGPGFPGTVARPVALALAVALAVPLVSALSLCLYLPLALLIKHMRNSEPEKILLRKL